MSFALLTDHVPQMRYEVIAILEWRNALVNKMDLRYARVAEQIALLKQMGISSFTPAPVFRRHRWQANKIKYPFHTDSAISNDSFTTGSESELWFSRRVTKYGRHL